MALTSSLSCSAVMPVVGGIAIAALGLSVVAVALAVLVRTVLVRTALGCSFSVSVVFGSVVVVDFVLGI